MAISGINSAVPTVLPTAIKPVLQASASANVGNQNGGAAPTTDAAATNVQTPNTPVDSAQQLNQQIARAQAANEQIVAALLTPPAALVNANGNGTGNGASPNNNRLDIFA